jgi:hypothetical protein
MVERVAGAAQPSRAALYVESAVLAEGSASKLRQVVEVKVDIVDDHQIDKSVVVVVAERSSCGITAIANVSLFSDVGEGAVSVVAVKNVAAEACEIEVGPPVIVVVSNGATVREALTVQAGLCCDVGKGAVMIVVIKSTGCGDAPEYLIDGRLIREVDVRPAIAVIVDEDNAATHRFHDVFLYRIGGVREGDAGRRGDVLELRNGAAAAFCHPAAGRRGRRNRVPFAHLRLSYTQRTQHHDKRLQESQSTWQNGSDPLSRTFII